MKWWEISWFCYVFMAPSSVFLTFSWEISHNIIILRFCNIVEGQAKSLQLQAAWETSYFILFKWCVELQISKLLEPRLLFDCCLFWPAASIEKTTVRLCVCLVHTWVGTEKSVSFAHLGCHHRVQHDKWSGSLEQNIYAENSRFIKALSYLWLGPDSPSDSSTKHTTYKRPLLVIRLLPVVTAVLVLVGISDTDGSSLIKKMSLGRARASNFYYLYPAIKKL